MALKITNDQHYSDIADAIREKLNTNDTYLPSEMADAIESIPTGGGSSELLTIFIDYDGTVLYSYTASQIQALSSLPALPVHTGLTCQGWNWTLSELKAFAKPTVVGANYVTSDGKTKVYIDVPETDKTVYTYIAQTVANGVLVDWGDGSTPESLLSLLGNLTHTYADAGSYVVSFQVVSGTFTITGDANVGTKLIWSQNNGTERCCGAAQYIKKVEFGSGIAFTNYAFNGCKNLATVTVPNTVEPKVELFSESPSLKCVVLPHGYTSIPNYITDSDCNLKYLSIPSGVTSIGSYTAKGCYNLTRISIPDTVESIGAYAFNLCSGLKDINMPSAVKTIGTAAFLSSGIDIELNFSSSLTSIGDEAFSTTNVRKVTIDGNATIGDQVFEQCQHLTEVLITNRSASVGTNMFSTCRLLKKAIIRGTITEISNFMFAYCSSLTQLELPSTITTFGSSAFSKCSSLKDVILPASLTSMSRTVFSNCECIEELTVPAGVTILNNFCFSTMQSLRKIVFMGDITSIAANALTTDYGIREYDFTHCTSVPTLASDSCLTTYGNRQKIKVPAALYDEWIAATYWSSISSYIEAV